MHNELVTSLFEAYPLLRTVQAWTDAAYYNIPFLGEGSFRAAALQLRFFRASLQFACFASPDNQDVMAGVVRLIDAQIATNTEAHKIWKASRDMDAVREVYYNATHTTLEGALS